MEFTRIAGPIEEMEVWNASSSGATFVISFESRSGPGFHGDTGYAVSWRPIDQSRSAVSVGGSPFETLAEAKDACNAMAAKRQRATPQTTSSTPSSAHACLRPRNGSPDLGCCL